MKKHLLSQLSSFSVSSLRERGFMCVPLLQTEDLDNSPNVFFVAIYDINDWISVLKTHPKIQTPNIARLAERGMHFTNAHVQALVCNSFRISVLTSIRQSTTSLYGHLL